MARTNASNYSNPNYAYATADTDAFDRLDVAAQGQAMDAHDHSAGNGAAVARLAAGAIPNGTITNAKLASDTARANLLTNGGFEIWQRGTGPFTGAVWTADRWVTVLSGSDTISVSKDTVNVDASGACAAVTFTLGSGGGNSGFNQGNFVDSINELRGRTLSFSVRVRTSTPNAVRAAINNYYSTTSHYTYSSFHTGNGTYQTLSVTATLDPTATVLQVVLFFAASCTAYIDNAMLVVGSQPADYAPLHPADDMARCLRYYEILQPEVSQYVGAAGAVTLYAVPFRVVKPVTPTLTKNGTWNVTNCAQPVVGSRSGAETSMFYFYVTSTATGNTAAYPSASGQNISVEANP